MLCSCGAKFIDKALIGTEMQAMFIVDRAHEPIRIVSNKMNNENNFNFKLPEHKIHSSIMVSVVNFESKYPGSNPEKYIVFSNNTGQFFYERLTDNRAPYVTIDLRILFRGH